MEQVFKVGDTVEATWTGGRTSVHVITEIKDSPHGPFYRFYDSRGYEVGLHAKYLRLVRSKEDDK